MKILEILNTRVDLDWIPELGGYTTSFNVGDNEYGVTVAIEESILRVDFHLKKDGKIDHRLTGFGSDQFKVLGIITNGVKERFGNQDGYYLVAKRKVDPEGYDARKTAYRRIMDRLRVEMNMLHRIEEGADETIFYLAKDQETMDLMST